MRLEEISVRPVEKEEEAKYQQLMEGYHYLGSIPRISETLWYAGIYHGQCVGLISFSAAALNCAARDHWIGWSYRQRSGRLKLIVNNNCFLILPAKQVVNLGSKLLSLCPKRLFKDWLKKYGHPVLMVGTFDDPGRFHGGVYRASS